LQRIGGNTDALHCYKHPEDGLEKEIGRLLEPRLIEFENAAGLPGPNPLFRKRVVRAIASSLILNSLQPNELFALTKVRQIREEATKAARLTRALRAAVRALGTQQAAALKLGLWENMPEMLEDTADRAKVLNEWIDGARKEAARNDATKVSRYRMDVFSWLVSALADALEEATGKPVTVSWSADREQREGKIISLVELVRPIVVEWTRAQKNGALAAPNNRNARGEYVRRLIRDRGKTRVDPK
jgi:hypothetical protein